MWYKSNFFKYCTGIILVLLIVFLLGQVDFVLTPIRNALMVIAFPILLALLLYYLLRPLVRLLMRIKLPRLAAVIVSFLASIGLMALLVILAGNTIVNQFNELLKYLPSVMDYAEKTITDLIASGELDFLASEDIIKRASDFFEKVVPALGEGIFSGISTVISTVTALLVVPFVLFYFLKDDKMFAQRTVKLFPSKYQYDIRTILVDIDNTLSAYITGQAIVCLVIGVLMYIGYLIIGLEYGLVLSLFSMVTAIIPFLGPILGVIPAILVGLSSGYVVILKILIVMVIVQQLEGSLITPQIMGKRIHTHPVTIIMVILLSASLFGFVGILLAIPSYAILKVIVKNAVKVNRVIRG